MPKLLQTMNNIILAIDYGTERLGIAVSRGSLAEPLKIVLNDAQLFHELKKIFDAELPTKVIIGLSENIMAEKTKKFVAELKKNIMIPVEFADETLTSKIVHEKLLTSGASQRKRRQPIDHLAAAEFLQEYLDNQ